MNHRIRTQQREIQPYGKNTRRKEEGAYLKFIRSLPCIVHGTPGVEAAHLSTAKPEVGHLGSGGARKASDRWALPLCQSLHAQQHGMNEVEFWRMCRIDPYQAALVIHGLWSDYSDDAHDHCVKLIMAKVWSTA